MILISQCPNPDNFIIIFGHSSDITQELRKIITYPTKLEYDIILIFLLPICLSLLLYFPHIAIGQDYNQSLVNSVIENNSSKSVPWIGVDVVNVTKGIANVLGTNKSIGVLVTQVAAGSPAEVAGLKQGNQSASINGEEIIIGGDIIIKADNSNIISKDDYDKVLSQKKVGDSIVFTVLQENQTRNIGLTVGSRPGYVYESSSSYADPRNIPLAPYESLDLELGIKYPSTWQKVEEEGGKNIIFYSNPENSKDTFLERVELSFEPRNGYDTLQQGIISRVENIPYLLTILFDDIRDNSVSFRNSSATTLAGNQAHILEYSFIFQPVGEIIARQIITADDDGIYDITYFAESSKFNDYLPTIESMVKSFNISDVENYENFDMGMRIKHFEYWHIQEDDEPAQDSVSFVHDIENNDVYEPTFDIFASDTRQDRSSLNQELNDTIELEESWLSDNPNFRLIESAWSHLENMDPIYNITVSYGDPDFGIIFYKAIITEQNDRIYTVAYEYARDHPDLTSSINGMIKSIEFFRSFYDPEPNLGLLLQYPSDLTIDERNDTTINLCFDSDSVCSYSEPPKLVIKANRIGNSSHSDIKPDVCMSEVNKKNITLMTTLGVQLCTNAWQGYENGKSILQVKATFNNTIYDFTYSSPYDQYNQFIPTAEKIINTTKIIQSFPVKQVGGKLNFKSNSTYGFNVTYPADYLYPNDYGDGFVQFRRISPVLSVSINSTEDGKLNVTVPRDIIDARAPDGSDVKFGAVIDGYDYIEPLEIETTNKNRTLSINFPAYSSTIDIIGTTNNTDAVTTNTTVEGKGVEWNTFDLKAGNGIYHIGYMIYPDIATVTNITINSMPHMFYSQTLDLGKLPLGDPFFEIFVLPSEGQRINDVVNEYFRDITTSFKDLKIITKNLASYKNYPAYDLQYIGDDFMYMQRIILNGIDKNFYVVSYIDKLDKFYNFLPIMQQMTNTLLFSSDSKSRTYTGFKVGDGPWGIAVNPRTNMVYVANSQENTVSAINGSNNEIVSNIAIDNSPIAIAVNPIKNKIYVTQSGSISVIDGKNNSIELTKTLDMESPSSIAFNPSTDNIYVADADSKNISKIDASTYKIMQNISTMPAEHTERGRDSACDSGIGIAVDDLRNRIYVVNFNPPQSRQNIENATGNVTVIDGAEDKILESIPVDFCPQRIALDQHRNNAYVIGSCDPTRLPLCYDYNANYIAIIDLSTNKVERYFIGGDKFDDVATNPFTNKIYVTDSGLGQSTTIHVIEPRFEPHLLLNASTISVDGGPSFLSVDPYANIIYTNNYQSDTVSKINGASNNIMYGVRFDVNDQPIEYNVLGIKISINSSKSVNIRCNDKAISDDSYIYYDNSTLLKCSAQSTIPLSPLISSSWSGLDGNSSSGFTVTKYGTMTGTFIDLQGLLEVLGPAISIIILVAIVLIASFPPTRRKVSFKTKALIKNEMGSALLEDIKSRLKLTDRQVRAIENNILQKYDYVYDAFEAVPRIGSEAFENINLPPRVKNAIVESTILGTVRNTRTSIERNKAIPGTREEETTVISKTDIITVNASVIVGVLILISLSEGFEVAEQTQISIITANIVFPFAISAVLAVRNYDKFAIRLMIAGFINLIISIILIAIMRL